MIVSAPARPGEEYLVRMELTGLERRADWFVIDLRAPRKERYRSIAGQGDPIGDWGSWPGPSGNGMKAPTTEVR